MRIDHADLPRIDDRRRVGMSKARTCAIPVALRQKALPSALAVEVTAA
jgi:hypothetical protein